MQTLTLLYIILGLLLSISVAFFQYFYKNKDKRKVNILLFTLKAFSLFLLSLLLINPKITTKETENIKPVLSVLADNSLSTKHFKEDNAIKEWLTNFKTNTALNKKFNIKYYSFGEKTSVLDSLTFDETQTDIAQTIQTLYNLEKDNLGATILISDGNQTFGNDYNFVQSKQAIYPIVLGDTIKYKDVKIAQLNVNKYSYIKNKFPVETILLYEGEEEVTTQFSIYSKGKRIFRQNVSFSKEKKTKTITITANLTAGQEGLNYYTASVSKLKDEKNTKNNSKAFSVEIIDEQTNVLILSSVLHPDLGALKKAIEANKQRKANIFLINDFKGDLKDYQFVIFYQPTQSFSKYFQEQKSNYLIISGTKTDWRFINNLQLGFIKNAIQQSEDYGANYNEQFLTFYQKDIDFSNYPPLRDKFGEIKLQTVNQTLLYQNINGIKSDQPLLSTFERGDDKFAILFGEGIWKWRAASFRQTNSFQDFDEFIGNLTQYLASNKKRKRLEVSSENLYPANSTITITAFYVDKNYQFDARASLLLTLTNTETKKQQTIPFSLINNSYQVRLENIASGNYTYKVAVEGQNVNSYGRFIVTDYQVEEQFTNANQKKLQYLADRTKGKLFYPTQQNELKQELLNNTSYFTTQKSINKEQNLIDWKWILFFVIALLSTEWFIRKYYGKI